VTRCELKCISGKATWLSCNDAEVRTALTGMSPSAVSMWNWSADPVFLEALAVVLAAHVASRRQLRQLLLQRPWRLPFQPRRFWHPLLPLLGPPAPFRLRIRAHRDGGFLRRFLPPFDRGRIPAIWPIN